MSLIARSPLLAGLNYAKGQVLHRLKLRGHFSGSTGLQKTTEDAAAYARRVVDDYLTYGASGDCEYLEGKDVLEIGPGDNLGVALILLAKGAGSVTCVDGFAPTHNKLHNQRIYHAIYTDMTVEEKRRVQDTVQVGPDGTASIIGERIVSRYGVPIDDTAMPFPSGSFDIVLSRAVLEHLRDLRRGWDNMVKSLRQDGEMWHKVDFRCHDFFSEVHPLYFLTVPDPIWNFISQPDPTLNRERFPTYRELAARDFVEIESYISHVVNKQEFSPHVKVLNAGSDYDEQQINTIRKIRSRLPRKFADWSVEDLMITGIFLIVRKPRLDHRANG